MKKIYILTTFLSSFLLFQIQPIMGKYVLPYFGGSSSVWNVSMLFFMVILLLGYMYAHLITQISPKNHIYFHLFVVFLSFVIVITNFLFGEFSIASNILSKSEIILNPEISIIQVLLLGIGLPYFVLSASNSLLQFWFNKAIKKSPYKLYSYSNAGGLIGLITYPFFIEPILKLNSQGIIWSIGFTIYFICIILCISFFVKSYNEKFVVVVTSNKTLNWKLYLKWIFLSTLPSVMLIAVTNKITLGMAPIPFLWVVPLVIYLFSFVLIFNDDYNFYLKKTYFVLFFLYSLNVLFFKSQGVEAIVFHLFGLFMCCMICNGELYKSKPSPDDLTSFYLSISIGGALGGILVGILSPILLPDFWELKIVAYIIVVMSTWLILDKNVLRILKINTMKKRFVATCLISIVLLFCIFRQILHDTNDLMYVTRNFYGVIKVKLFDDSVRLINGGIEHGIQSFSEPRKALTYYERDSGIGLAIRTHPKRKNHEDMRVGIVGLGTGCLSSYGRTGDYYKFYEINNDVIDVSKKYFSFLDTSEAEIDIKLGDARITMEDEIRNNNLQKFDILAIDAFSDDSIPTHLITKEAAEIFLKHLADERGVLAYHISNKYLDLRPVIKKIALYFDMDVKFIESWDANWALLSKDKNLLNNEDIIEKEEAGYVKDVSLWTDKYTNIFTIIK